MPLRVAATRRRAGRLPIEKGLDNSSENGADAGGDGVEVEVEVGGWMARGSVSMSGRVVVAVVVVVVLRAKSGVMGSSLRSASEVVALASAGTCMAASGVELVLAVGDAASAVVVVVLRGKSGVLGSS